MSERLPNDFGILQDQMLMIEQKIKSSCQLRRAALVHSIQHPQGFGQYQLRDPGASFHKRLGCGDLLRIIPNQQSHQDIRVNGAHASFARSRGYPASH